MRVFLTLATCLEMTSAENIRKHHGHYEHGSKHSETQGHRHQRAHHRHPQHLSNEAEDSQEPRPLSEPFAEDHVTPLLRHDQHDHRHHQKHRGSHEHGAKHVHRHHHGRHGHHHHHAHQNHHDDVKDSQEASETRPLNVVVEMEPWYIVAVLTIFFCILLVRHMMALFIVTSSSGKWNKLMRDDPYSLMKTERFIPADASTSRRSAPQA